VPGWNCLALPEETRQEFEVSYKFANSTILLNNCAFYERELQVRLIFTERSDTFDAKKGRSELNTQGFLTRFCLDLHIADGDNFLYSGLFTT
jgi:hypothetical protein